MKTWSRKFQAGQAMLEYTVCALLLILALFTPVPPESKSVADMLVEAIQKNHEAKVYAIGSPVTGSSKGF
jgi:hypothetical protein